MTFFAACLVAVTLAQGGDLPAPQVPAKTPGATTSADPAASPTVDEGMMNDLFHWLQGHVPESLHGELAGIQYWQYIAAFLCILLGLALRKISDFIFENVILKAARKTRFQFDDLLVEAFGKPVGVVFLLLGLWTSAGMLNLGARSEGVRTFVAGAVQVAFAVDAMWLLFRLVDVLAVYMSRAALRTDSKLDDQLVPIIKKSLKVFAGVLALIAVLQNLGYNVGSLLAGLGIGGLAVAMAAKDTLANFFGGLVIFTDRPFRVGDWIRLGDIEGTVEQIGFRSTRVRTFTRTLVTIPNSQLVDTAIDNKTAMPMRRVRMTVGVTYETTAEQMEALLADFKAILGGDKDIDPETMLVRFINFGESSLDILLQYFTRPTGYVEHTEVVERINLAVMRAVEARGLSIAFPTRTVYFEGDIARNMAGKGNEK